MHSGSSKVRGVVTAGLVLALGVMAPAGVALAEDEPIVVAAATDDVALPEAPEPELQSVDAPEPTAAEPAVPEAVEPQAAELVAEDVADSAAEPGELVDSDDAVGTETTPADVPAAAPAEAAVIPPASDPAPVAEAPASEAPAEAAVEADPPADSAEQAPAEKSADPTPAGFVLTTQVKRDAPTINATNADNLATTAADTVAKIGDTEYESLQAAVDAAQSGDTIQLMTDVELTSTLNIRGTTVLDLGGHAISCNTETQIAVEVLDNASLTVSNTGSVSGCIASTKSTAGYGISSSGNLTIRGDNVVVNASRIGIWNKGNGNLLIESGATVEATGKTNVATGIYNEGSLVAKSSVIRGFFYGVRNHGVGTVDIVDGSVCSTYSGSYYKTTKDEKDTYYFTHAIYDASSGAVTIAGNATIGGENTYFGIRGFNGSNIVINDGSITASTYGIYSYGSTVSVLGGRVYGTSQGIRATKTADGTANSTITIGAGATIEANEKSGIAILSQGTNATGRGSNIIYLTGGTIKGSSGICIYSGDKLVMTGGSIETGSSYAVSNNGSSGQEDTTITISGGIIDSQGMAIYHAGNGTLSISGDDTLIKATWGAIEMRAGTLNMTGGTVVGDAVDVMTKPNGNGHAVFGAGIAVAQHTTKKPVVVNISGGTVEGPIALFETDVQKNGEESVKQIDINIAGGTFVSKVGSNDFMTFKPDEYRHYANKTSALIEDYGQIDVTGGIFSNPVPEAYCNEKLVPSYYGSVGGEDRYTVAKPIAKPTQGENYVYDGLEKHVPLLNDAEGIELGESKVNAGSYETDLTPAEGFAWAYEVDKTDTSEHADKSKASVVPVTIPWTIAARDVSLCAPSAPGQMYDGAEKRPVSIVDAVAGRALVEGEDYDIVYVGNVAAGTATYRVVGKGNYTGVVDGGTFQISRADIADADFADIARQVYAGKAVEPGVSGTFAGSALVEGEDFEVSYAGNEAAGTATVTITGKGNFTGTRALTFEIAEPEAEPEPEPEPAPAPEPVVGDDEGEVDTEVEVADGAPVEGVGFSVDTDKLLTDEEKALVDDGARIDVVLSVGEADVDEETKASVESTVAERFEGDVQVVYLDLALNLLVDGAQYRAIHNTGTPVSVTLALPDELLPADGVERTYVVVRVHDGQVDLLEAAFDAEAGTITFSTDKFSTYGIAYADAEATVAEAPAEGTPTEPTQEAAPEKPAPKHLATTGGRAAAAIPATGDAAVEVYVAEHATGALGLLSLLAAARRRRRAR